MNEAPPILYHSPYSRSEVPLWMLEELGRPYELRLIDLVGGEHKRPEHLARNSMGKVPVLEHRGEFISETMAICCYLADIYSEAGLAPAPDEPLRGSYLRWLFYSPACIEPGLFLEVPDEYAPNPGQVGWGSWQQVVETLTEALTAASPWLLGERFTTADIAVGSALLFARRMNKLPTEPIFAAYCDRLQARPAVVRRAVIDREQSAKLGGVPWEPKE